MPNPTWFRKRMHDPFLKKAHREDLRSRAAYKLQEIAEKYKLIHSYSKVLDLGCAPGSWTQMVRRFLGPKGLVVGIDLLAVEPVEGATLLQGDITDPAMQAAIEGLSPGGFDLILSDMAPNTTGIHHADTARSAELVGLVLDLCGRWLKPGGACLAKVFEGAEYPALRQRAKTLFGFAKTMTPEASLARSREVYLLGTGFRGAGAAKPDRPPADRPAPPTAQSGQRPGTGPALHGDRPATGSGSRGERSATGSASRGERSAVKQGPTADRPATNAGAPSRRPAANRVPAPIQEPPDKPPPPSPTPGLKMGRKKPAPEG